MNDRNLYPQSLFDQAAILADLTRDLALCCHAKEVELFDRYNLTAAEGFFILTLAEMGTATPAVLAEKLKITRSRLTPLSQQLVKKGLVQRSESSKDRRQRELRLSGEGLAVARQAHDFRVRFHARLLEGFAPSERERALEVLSHLRTRLNELRREFLSQ